MSLEIVGTAWRSRQHGTRRSHAARDYRAPAPDHGWLASRASPAARQPLWRDAHERPCQHRDGDHNALPAGRGRAGHNEEAVIQRCLRAFTPATRLTLRSSWWSWLITAPIATAEYAAETGARVLVRCEPDKRGKGYALAFAFDVLCSEGFNAVVVVDADTVVEPNMIAEFCRLFATGCRRRAVSLWCQKS